MGPSTGEADHERALVDPRETGERLLARRGDHLGTYLEQREQVPQVTRKEGHLVDSHEHDAVSTGDQARGLAHVVERHPARGLVEVDEIRRERRLELTVPEREQSRLGLLAAGTRSVCSALVLVTCGVLKLREA